MIVNPQEAVLQLPSRAARVYLALVVHGPSTDDEIEATTGLSRATIQRAVTELESVGAVVREERKTSWGAFDASLFTAVVAGGDRLTPETAQVSDCLTAETVTSDAGNSGAVGRLTAETVDVRYAVCSKPLSPVVGVLRTPTPGAISSPGRTEMGYDFFEEHTKDDDDIPTKQLRKRPSDVKREREASKRDWKDESTWTHLDVAKFWRDEAMRKYPLKASGVGEVQETARIFGKRSRDHGETIEIQVRLIRKFLADSRNVTQAGKGVRLRNMLFDFMNRNADGAREDLKRAEDTAEVEAIEAAMAAGEDVAPRVVDKKWAELQALVAQVDPS